MSRPRLVATDLDGDAREARVRMGAALDEADLRALLEFFRPYVPKKPKYAFHGD